MRVKSLMMPATSASLASTTAGCSTVCVPEDFSPTLT
jgi:hypothetical protein